MYSIQAYINLTSELARHSRTSEITNLDKILEMERFKSNLFTICDKQGGMKCYVHIVNVAQALISSIGYLVSVGFFSKPDSL